MLSLNDSRLTHEASLKVEANWKPDTWSLKENLLPLPYDENDWKNIRTSLIPKINSFEALLSISSIIKLSEALKLLYLKNNEIINCQNYDVTNSTSSPCFILQCGYCAESFDDASPEVIYPLLDTIKEASKILFHNQLDKVIMIPRIAGQYGKPRSQFYEVDLEGNKLYSYRGDIVHGFPTHERLPDPSRLITAYDSSKLCLSIIKQKYKSINGCVNPDKDLIFEKNLFVSHESFCLPYEEAMTHMIISEDRSFFYNNGAHFLWLGERTTKLDGAHVEYLRGIKNPIGIKIGPSKTPEQVVKLLDFLNPDKKIGRITLITRLGAGNIFSLLPSFISTIKESGHPVLWICDPMHGNTKTTTTRYCNGIPIKTRFFDDIFEECFSSFIIHRQMNSICSGLHIEMTHDPTITECVGGISQPVNKDEIGRNYTTKCDPRLNKIQFIDLIMALKNVIHANIQ